MTSPHIASGLEPRPKLRVAGEDLHLSAASRRRYTSATDKGAVSQCPTKTLLIKTNGETLRSPCKATIWRASPVGRLPYKAVAELIWNSLDADADSIKVTLSENLMGGLESHRGIRQWNGDEVPRRIEVLWAPGRFLETAQNHYV